jgi:hypothetical protein
MSVSSGADTGFAASRTSRDEFLDLICADDELLRVEFDAIIEATWGPASAGDRRRPAAPRIPAGRRAGAAISGPQLGLASGRRGVPLAEPWRRQRSPPSGLSIK